jgi:hypothetical protein
MAERPFGSDVNRIWLGLLKPALDASHAGQRKTDFRIARNRQSAELVRTEQLKLDAERACFARDVAKGSHDAIDLRMPSVGRDEDFHSKPLIPARAGIHFF